VRLESQLKALSPLGVLDRGYSGTTDAAGSVVRRAAKLNAGDHVHTRVAEGSFEAVVESQS
jgi:exodeoxyribonuclease VII large subunit